MTTTQNVVKALRGILAVLFVLWIVSATGDVANQYPSGQIPDGAVIGIVISWIIAGVLWLIADKLVRVIGGLFG